MVSGSRSATTVSSKANRYSPGLEFRYQFEANRTFSREGKRPRTTPALTNNAFTRKQKDFQPAAEDIIAMAQSPSPSFLDESLGGSLMMLRKGYSKVKPEKFLELQKLTNQPTPTPLTSPRSEISTPRLVKHMAENMAAGNHKQELSTGSKQISKETQYDYASESPISSRHSSKRPISSEWSATEMQRSHIRNNDFTERCVRCSEFPDIQIEGRSLSKILTNDNTTMAKEYCEVLGPDTCPDCFKIRSQKHHEENCMKNTPAASGDVYKLVLVHEKAPHLNIREVRRKLLDGEISDKVLSISRWTEFDTSAVLHRTLNAKPDDKCEERPSLLPEILDHKTLAEAPAHKSAKPFKHSGHPVFETIHEASETNNFFEEDKMPPKSMTIELQSKDKMVFRQHSAEKTRKIQIVSASEHVHVLEQKNLEKLNGVSQTKSVRAMKHKENKVSLAEKVDRWNQADAVELNNVAYSTQKSYKQPKYFTHDVIPSKNFFFDIPDLAERLHSADLPKKKQTEKNKDEEFLKLLSANISPPNVKDDDTNKTGDTDSVASSDSLTQKNTKFNMAYEPPTFFGNKKRLLLYDAKDTGSTLKKSTASNATSIEEIKVL